MCGIYGMLARAGAPLGHPEALDRMGEALKHRGPDGHGTLTNPHAAFGVERLRVVDVDARADQPFADASRAVWLACNGEIYNAADIRARYPSYPFRSRSDVECILPLYLDGGPNALAELEGMFALAIYDEARARLVLARDRAGEKPLFLADVGREIWFASEIQALLKCPALPRTVDRRALGEYTALGYAREPNTLFAAVRQVPAGTMQIFDLAAAGSTVVPYWTSAALGSIGPSAVAAAIERAVARQVAADVPIGVFTSGGLDSSILATLAARGLGPNRVHTFAVGFPDRSFDERLYARRLTRELGTRHVEVVADDDALATAFQQIGETAEPIADPAALPTVLLARAARERVTVVLSGEGADELFGGYPTYLGHGLARRWCALPEALRSGIAHLVEVWPASDRRVPLEFLLKRFVAEAALPWRPRHERWTGPGLPPDVLHPRWRSPAEEISPPSSDDDPVRAAMRHDFSGALRNRLLVKVDRATMRASLEARAPYLDPGVIGVAWAHPASAHVAGLRTKRLLRRVSRSWLPPFILRRGKRGLSVPIGSWINGGFRAETDRLLAPARLRREGFFDPAVVARLLEEHRTGRGNHARGLWTLIAFQHWVERWKPESCQC